MNDHRSDTNDTPPRTGPNTPKGTSHAPGRVAAPHSHYLSNGGAMPERHTPESFARLKEWKANG